MEEVAGASLPQPRHLLVIAVFKRGDFRYPFERKPDVVEALDQAAFVEGIDLEMMFAPVGPRNRLQLKVGADRGTGPLVQLRAQPCHHALASWLQASHYRGWISIEMRQPPQTPESLSWQEALRSALAAAQRCYGLVIQAVPT